METKISLRKVKNEIEVVVPFNEQFIKSAKNLEGKWNAEKGAWIFDKNLEEYVKYLLVRIYGVKRSKEEIEKEIADLKEKLAKLEAELNNL